MAEKIGIRFKRCGKMYYFAVNGADVKRGDSVVVESSFGMTIGHVVTDKLPVNDKERDLKKILRKATEKDFKTKKDNAELEREARAYSLERIHARGLQMKLVCTEATLDKKRIIFYFTADGRIDFRELVKDLAAKFKTRIEMRQIGVRDETKLLGGIGMCGRQVCCNTFLTGFSPISIKMAKKQELVLNTAKLSGLCGRLMCCLGYEYGEAALKEVASSGLPVETTGGDDFQEVAELPEAADGAEGTTKRTAQDHPVCVGGEGVSKALPEKQQPQKRPDEEKKGASSEAKPSDSEEKKPEDRGRKKRRKFNRHKRKRKKRKKSE